MARLEAYAQSIGIGVEYQSLKGAKGYSVEGKVVVDEKLDLGGRASVPIHEIAHEKVHHHGQARKLRLTREQVEAEAEATAFVVSRHFGLEAKSGYY